MKKLRRMARFPIVARFALVIVVLFLTCGCAESEAYAVGPTIDGAGHVGVELRGAAGPVLNGERTPIPPYAPAQPEGLWIAGVTLSAGATTAHPYAWASLAPYVEYVRLETPEQPWGWHAGASLGGSTGRELVLALYSGPQYLRSQTVVDTNDGWTQVSDLSGMDLEMQLRLRPAATTPRRALRWRLGLLYVGQRVTIY